MFPPLHQLIDDDDKNEEPVLEESCNPPQWLAPTWLPLAPTPIQRSLRRLLPLFDHLTMRLPCLSTLRQPETQYLLQQFRTSARDFIFEFGLWYREYSGVRMPSQLFESAPWLGGLLLKLIRTPWLHLLGLTNDDYVETTEERSSHVNKDDYDYLRRNHALELIRAIVNFMTQEERLAIVEGGYFIMALRGDNGADIASTPSPPHLDKHIPSCTLRSFGWSTTIQCSLLLHLCELFNLEPALAHYHPEVLILYLRHVGKFLQRVSFQWFILCTRQSIVNKEDDHINAQSYQAIANHVWTFMQYLLNMLDVPLDWSPGTKLDGSTGNERHLLNRLGANHTFIRHYGLFRKIVTAQYTKNVRLLRYWMTKSQLKSQSEKGV